MMAVKESNGEKKILWRLLEVALAFGAAVAVIATTLNAWVVKDYLSFKRQSDERWRLEATTDAARDERDRWQQVTLKAIADKMQIPVPDPPVVPQSIPRE